MVFISASQALWLAMIIVYLKINSFMFKNSIKPICQTKSMITPVQVVRMSNKQKEEPGLQTQKNAQKLKKKIHLHSSIKGSNGVRFNYCTQQSRRHAFSPRWDRRFTSKIVVDWNQPLLLSEFNSPYYCCFETFAFYLWYVSDNEPAYLQRISVSRNVFIRQMCLQVSVSIITDERFQRHFEMRLA